MLHIILFFFFNDTATTEIYTLSLHDALPISEDVAQEALLRAYRRFDRLRDRNRFRAWLVRIAFRLALRSEEHTSELQSLAYLVCRLLLEKKKKHMIIRSVYSMTYLRLRMHVC